MSSLYAKSWAGEDEAEHRPERTGMASHSPGSVLAPMAGLVVKVLSKNGEKVEAGQPIIVMEAMKMEVCVIYIFLNCYEFFSLYHLRNKML